MARAADPTPEQPVTREVLMGVPIHKDTARVEVREIRILPGAAAGLHVHNRPVLGSGDYASLRADSDRVVP